MRWLHKLFLPLFICTGCVPSSSVSIHHNSEAENALNTGVIFLRMQKLSEADAAFRAALELKVSAEGFDGLGCVALLSGDYNLAEEYFYKAREINPKYARAVAHMAYLEELRGSISNADKLYNQALIEDPSDIYTRNNFAGFLAEETGTINAARHELRKAQAIYPHEVIIQNLENIYEK